MRVILLALALVLHASPSTEIICPEGIKDDVCAALRRAGAQHLGPALSGLGLEPDQLAFDRDTIIIKAPLTDSVEKIFSLHTATFAAAEYAGNTNPSAHEALKTLEARLREYRGKVVASVLDATGKKVDWLSTDGFVLVLSSAHGGRISLDIPLSESGRPGPSIVYLEGKTYSLGSPQFADKLAAAAADVVKPDQGPSAYVKSTETIDVKKVEEGKTEAGCPSGFVSEAGKCWRQCQSALDCREKQACIKGVCRMR